MSYYPDRYELEVNGRVRWLYEKDPADIEDSNRRYDERKEKQRLKDERYNHLLKVVSIANKEALIKKHRRVKSSNIRTDVFGY